MQQMLWELVRCELPGCCAAQDDRKLLMLTKFLQLQYVASISYALI